jgi:hypothetical protein
MKTTPRKRTLNRRDEARFAYQLAARAGFIGVSTFLVGWFTVASTFSTSDTGVMLSLGRFQHLFEDGYDSKGGADLQAFWLVQDMTANAALLSLITQSFTLLERCVQTTLYLVVMDISNFLPKALHSLIRHSFFPSFSSSLFLTYNFAAGKCSTRTCPSRG